METTFRQRCVAFFWAVVQRFANSYTYRILRERDEARAAGEKLAQACLKHEDLREAVKEYTLSQGWGGPAMSWLEKLKFSCVLCGEPGKVKLLSLIQPLYCRELLCKSCQQPKM